MKQLFKASKLANRATLSKRAYESQKKLLWWVIPVSMMLINPATACPHYDVLLTQAREYASEFRAEYIKLKNEINNKTCDSAQDEHSVKLSDKLDAISEIYNSNIENCPELKPEVKKLEELSKKTKMLCPL